MFNVSFNCYKLSSIIEILVYLCFTFSNIIVQVACVAVPLLVPETVTHVPGKIGILIELCGFFIKTILIYMYTYL